MVSDANQLRFDAIQVVPVIALQAAHAHASRNRSGKTSTHEARVPAVYLGSAFVAFLSAVAWNE
jgi:hypothetical protein